MVGPGPVTSLPLASLTSHQVSLPYCLCYVVIALSLISGVQPQHDGHYDSSHMSWRPPWPPRLQSTAGALQNNSAALQSIAQQTVTASDHSSSDHVLHVSDISPSGEARAPSRQARSLQLHPFQCLQSQQSNVSAAAAEICACPDTWARAHMTLHHPSHVFRSQCWPLSSSGQQDCLPPVLTPSQLTSIMSDDAAVCHDAVSSILTRIVDTNMDMEESLAVLLSGHRMVECDTDNSHCQSCMAWYRTWMCLQEWPVYEAHSGKIVPPCPRQCAKVEMSCPFLTIYEDASMASGDPTFLCQDSSITSSSTEVHRTCCYEIEDHHSPSPPTRTCDNNSYSEESVPAPGEGEYVDLNTTDSCCSLGAGGQASAPLQAGGARASAQGGDNAHICDNMVIANRTLRVRRRQSSETPQSVIMSSDDDDMGVMTWWHRESLATDHSGSGHSTGSLIIILLSQLFFIFSKFYS